MSAPPPCPGWCRVSFAVGDVSTSLAPFAQEFFPRSGAIGFTSAPDVRELAGPFNAFDHCPGTAVPVDFAAMAAGVIPLDELTRLRVLVVHTNFAVGSAIARRLIDAEVVALAHAASVLDGNQDPGRYDVILLCPYLLDAHRDALLEVCATSTDAAVIELMDSEHGSCVLLHRAGAGTGTAADAVADALALPLAPIQA
jgi:hypothetical protein